jgi:hypothetical protein
MAHRRSALMSVTLSKFATVRTWYTCRVTPKKKSGQCISFLFLNRTTPRSDTVAEFKETETMTMKSHEWEELKTIEKSRRGLLKYVDDTHYTYQIVFTRFRGTIFPNHTTSFGMHPLFYGAQFCCFLRSVCSTSTNSFQAENVIPSSDNALKASQQ